MECELLSVNVLNHACTHPYLYTYWLVQQYRHFRAANAYQTHVQLSFGHYIPEYNQILNIDPDSTHYTFRNLQYAQLYNISIRVAVQPTSVCGFNHNGEYSPVLSTSTIELGT